MAAGRYPRLVEHQLSWALTDLKRDGLIENPRRGVWRRSGAALEAPAPAIPVAVAAERLQRPQTMPYRVYLRAPEWRRTRAAALERAGYCCSLDITHTDSLEVHHRTYERLGHELAGDLVVLCGDCHRLHHRAYGRPRRPAQRPRTSFGPPTEPSAPPSGAPDRPHKSLVQRLLGR